MVSNNEYMRKYMANRQRERIAAARTFLGGCCVRCGSIENLQFDHIDPSTKLFVISTGASGRKLENFWAEVKKCQLLCESCHIDKTIVEDKGQQLARFGHGTLSTYRYCKCALCKKAKSDNNRRYRENKKSLRS